MIRIALQPNRDPQDSISCDQCPKTPYQLVLVSAEHRGRSSDLFLCRSCLKLLHSQIGKFLEALEK